MKRRSLEEELAALETLRHAPPTDALVPTIRAALGSARSFVVERAAVIAREQALSELERELVTALERFYTDPVKKDPGCKAKLATLEALDFLEHNDPGPFLKAARHVQMEPAWGPPVDTAIPLRGRALVGLARQGHQDLALLAGELLADPGSPVRQAAADALALLGDRGAAGALTLKLGVGDEDGNVLTACASALLALAPDFALPRLRAMLVGKDRDARQTAALALGQSRLEAAGKLLIEALEEAVTAADRAVPIRALGLHRSDASLAVLLERVETGATADAKAAVEALAARRFEPGVVARVAAAVAENGEKLVKEAYASAFSDVAPDPA